MPMRQKWVWDSFLYVMENKTIKKKEEQVQGYPCIHKACYF